MTPSAVRRLCCCFFSCPGRCRYSYGHGSARISLVRLSEALGWAPTAVVRELRRCMMITMLRSRYTYGDDFGSLAHASMSLPGLISILGTFAPCSRVFCCFCRRRRRNCCCYC